MTCDQPQANSKQSDAVLHNLDMSPVWTEALSEKFTALRAAWGLPADAHVSSFWVGHAVQASRAEVEAALSALGPQADCVRLLIVNDSKTCIVAGKPEQCAALISKLGVPAFPIEQGMAGHCQEVAPYVDEIARIHSMLRVPQGGAATGVTFYTSSVPGGGVAQMPADGRNAGALVASVYRNTADFPALVGAAAARGADVFVELGAGDLRAAATKDILGKQGVPHVAVAFDKRGAEPWRQLLKMAATLITHGGTGCKVLRATRRRLHYAVRPPLGPGVHNLRRLAACTTPRCWPSWTPRSTALLSPRPRRRRGARS